MERRRERSTRKAPLILELGVAGRSVARHVYQNTVLSAQRPLPALKSEAYRNRVERDWAQSITSTADVSKGSLHGNKDQEAKIIEARQKKRAQMAEDKTTRVAEAMGTMAIGGGRGRTVTSSLMGPGGTFDQCCLSCLCMQQVVSCTVRSSTYCRYGTNGTAQSNKRRNSRDRVCGAVGHDQQSQLG
jgi:hypothetical protein